MEQKWPVPRTLWYSLTGLGVLKGHKEGATEGSQTKELLATEWKVLSEGEIVNYW